MVKPVYPYNFVAGGIKRTIIPEKICFCIFPIQFNTNLCPKLRCRYLGFQIGLENNILRAA
jgi:hypothetical protein